jgi:hypothetical protein
MVAGPKIPKKRGKVMNATITSIGQSERLPVTRLQRWARNGALIVGFCGLAVSFEIEAGKPGGSPGGKTPPNPDIVYLSASSQSVNTAEVRGVALGVQTSVVTSSDSSLLRNATGRSYSSVAWSPDGKRYAWIENGAILTAAPGGKPTLLYPTVSGDPKPLTNPDALAWGPDCCGGGDSTLVFLSELPSFAIQALTVQADVVIKREELLALNSHCDTPDVCTISTGSSFAFSPEGQVLAFSGVWDILPPGVWAIPMAVAAHTPSMILTAAAIGGTNPIDSVRSMDWSPDGTRLALSVITGPDPESFPWRDLKIVDLHYTYDGAIETFSLDGVRSVNPGSVFGDASSEHSPQWDPNPTDDCQRLVFSQSSDAGRAMYLVDLAGGSGCNPALRSISAKNPRTLDWRSKQ